MNRALLTACALGALGFSGVLVLLPNPLRRWVLAEVDRVTEEIVTAAAAAWNEALVVE